MNRDAEPDIEPLLRQLLQRGWMLLCCGSRTQPDALAAVHRTQVWADVVILRGHDRAAAYRTLTQPPTDPTPGNQSHVALPQRRRTHTVCRLDHSTGNGNLRTVSNPGGMS